MPSAFNQSSSWPLWPVHGGKPLPSDHTEFAFEDLAAPIHDRVVSEVFHPRVFAYVPKEPNGRAALVLAGGGYTKLVVGKEGIEVAEWLASLGYHAFVLVHRFPCERFGSQAPVDDAIEAMRQIRARAAEFGLDANRIGVCGLSSGGHLAALAGTSGLVNQYQVNTTIMDIEGTVSPHTTFSSEVDAVVDWFGPSDFLKEDSCGSVLVHNAPDSPESSLIGGPIQDNVDKCALANPITYIDSRDPPFLLIHGDADRIVPHCQSEILFKALQKKGVPSQYVLVPGAKHVEGLMEEIYFKMMVDFFMEEAKKK